MLINASNVMARIAAFAAFVAFKQIRTRARLRFWRSHLFSGHAKLDSFADLLPALSPARRFVGTQEIPLAQITGSVGRCTDFDRTFHPLKAYLCDRWANVFQLSQSGNLPPIRVYRAGAQYFVEDGHHRVSVARTRGMTSIRAEVWEYTPKQPAYQQPRLCCLPA